jgi:WD40 repeat protein
VAVYPADGDVPRALGDVASEGRSLRFSPDGRWLATNHDSGLWLWDLRSGEGRRIELPAHTGQRRRMAYAFVDGAQALRIATALLADGDAKPGIVVWQTGVTQPRVHELFSEADLSQLVSSDDGGAVLMETADARALMWFLDEDHFALLPDGVLSKDLPVTRLRVSPDRSEALLDLDGGRETVLVDIATGQRRTLPPLIDPVAWGSEGTVVDVMHLRRLRKWVDPAPAEPRPFLAWLEAVTAIEVDSGTLR